MYIRYHNFELAQVGNYYILRDRTAIGATRERRYTTLAGAKKVFDKETIRLARVMCLRDWRSTDKLIVESKENDDNI